MKFLNLRRQSKIKEEIAKLSEEANYLRSLGTENGMLPEHICMKICSKLGKVAALKERLAKFK